MRSDSKGFSLIELLIVIAIILIIAAIAIPNLLRSRMAANQAAAVGSLRVINSSEVSYAASYNIGYAFSLVYLGPPASGLMATSTAAGLIDSVLAGGSGGSAATSNQSLKSGYTFTYSAATTATGAVDIYGITAVPSTYGTTGNVYYFTDQSFVIRQNITGTASSSDSPIGG